MSAEENKELVRHYIEAVWNQRNIAALDELLAPNYRRYVSATAAPLSREGQRQRINGFHTAFPDLHFTIEDLLAESDRVTFRVTLRGTHQGVFPFFQGIAPTGKQVTISVLDVVRVEGKKFAEQWGGPDLFDLLRQLDALPFPQVQTCQEQKPGAYLPK
ncbi:MAG: ester cyclase [Verrucomicrobia bacterium]|nr:ester cyclase [Verrucomicrobiota bacterium]